MQRYPLSWPQGWKRTTPSQRARARFHTTTRQYASTPGANSWLKKSDLSVAQASARVLDELRRFGVLDGDAIISTNLKLRLDGLPRSDQAAPADPGVAVYWTRFDQQMKCMATDQYDRVADNLAAIAATLEAMRAIERHGGAQILERAFTGFDALPAPGQTTAPWRQVLDLQSNEASLRVAEAAYRRLRSQHHPDKGGDANAFNAVQRAWEQAQIELGG